MLRVEEEEIFEMPSEKGGRGRMCRGGGGEEEMRDSETQ